MLTKGPPGAQISCHRPLSGWLLLLPSLSTCPSLSSSHHPPFPNFSALSLSTAMPLPALLPCHARKSLQCRKTYQEKTKGIKREQTDQTNVKRKLHAQKRISTAPNNPSIESSPMPSTELPLPKALATSTTQQKQQGQKESHTGQKDHKSRANSRAKSYSSIHKNKNKTIRSNSCKSKPASSDP